MKVLTIFGTRPEIIRLSVIMKKLDTACEHVMAYTGQNYDPLLSDVFFDELRLRKPDVFFNAGRGAFGANVGAILDATAEAILRHGPDRILVLGDTNSGLAAIAASRLGVPVYHMEAGNRCHDDSVPEECNRKIIDHISRVNMPYTEGSRSNLIAEGVPSDRIFVTGNPILEVLYKYNCNTNNNAEVIFDEELKRVYRSKFALATIHRAETVNSAERLARAMSALSAFSQKFEGMRVIMSVHPHTREMMHKFGISCPDGISMFDPMPFSKFVALEREAAIVLTDSGTVQEECCIFGVPTVTMRDTTERPETVECGSNMISGLQSEDVVRCAEIMISRTGWRVPDEYVCDNVSDKIISIICGK